MGARSARARLCRGSAALLRGAPEEEDALGFIEAVADFGPDEA
jgi:hypothetical protein